MDSWIDWMDWGTLWKSRTSNFLTVAEWRSGQSRAHETHVIYVPDDRSSSRAYVHYEEHVLHMICDKPDTKVVASNLNRTKSAAYIAKLASERDQNVGVKIDISDGPYNQYKCKDAFGPDKWLAIQYGWDCLKSFSVAGWGKDKVDLYGAKVPYLIRTIIVPLLKEKCMQLDLVCDRLNDLCGKPIDCTPESRFTLRMWIHVPETENAKAHASRAKWKPLKDSQYGHIVPVFYLKISKKK